MGGGTSPSCSAAAFARQPLDGIAGEAESFPAWDGWPGPPSRVGGGVESHREKGGEHKRAFSQVL